MARLSFSKGINRMYVGASYFTIHPHPSHMYFNAQVMCRLPLRLIWESQPEVLHYSCLLLFLQGVKN